MFLGNIYSQKLSFLNYSTNEGLPQSQVNAIVQDKDGYLWVGTLGGLAKFNGKDFVTYSTLDGLLSNRISCLNIINDTLWIGQDRAVSMMVNGKITSWKIEGSEDVVYVSKIIKYNSEVYVSVAGFGLFKLHHNGLKKVRVNNNKLLWINDLIVFKNKLFVATNDGLYCSKDGIKFKLHEKIKNPYVRSLNVKNNDLYIGSDSYLSSKIFIKLSSKNKVKVLSVPFELDYLKKVIIDNSNNYWFIGVNILHCVDFSKNKIISYDKKNGLPNVSFNTIFQDKNDNIWIATDGKGLLKFPSYNFSFIDLESGVPSNIITSIEKNKNELWMTSFDNGVIHLNENLQLKNHYINNFYCWSQLKFENEHWFGCDNGLFTYSYINKTFSKNEIYPFKITRIKHHNKTIYICGDKGLSLYQNKKIKNISFKEKKEEGVTSDIEFINNQIFLAADNGLFHFKNEVIERDHVFNKTNTIFCLKSDNYENLWIGTENGLFLRTNKKYKRIQLGKEPSSNLIMFLNRYTNYIVIGTNNGIFLINEKTFKTYHFGKEEGLIDIECNINSSCIDNDNFLWFGTASGTVKFNLNNLNLKNEKPIVHLNSILINHQDIRQTKYSKFGNIPKNLNLPFSKNNITFQLDAVLFNKHNQLQYQYWVEGLDEKWYPANKNNLINLMGIPYGEFKIHFRAISNDNEYSNEIIFPVSINKPFYLTWWFVVISIILVFSIIYFLIRFRIKKEKEKNEKETLDIKSKLIALEQKSLNASMNRHFIFNALNSIQYFINSSDKLAANRYLTNFAKLIRKNLDSTVEEGSMIAIGQEIEGLELYLGLEAMRFKGKFSYTIKVDEDIDLETIKIPAMLLQPFIENSIIHGVLPNESVHGQILIEFKLIDNFISISIEDNGIGIKNSIELKKQIDGDHKSQGMEITSKRIALIKQLSNQGFDLVGPEQIIGNNHSINGTRVLIKIPIENLENQN